MTSCDLGMHGIMNLMSVIGLPVPKKLKEVLEQLHEEADEKKEDE